MSGVLWERLGSGLALLLGLGALVLSRDLPSLEGGYPGPSLFPQILGILLISASLALFLRKQRSLVTTPGRLVPLLAMATFLFLAPWFFGRLGLLPTSTLYAIVTTLFLRGRWWEAFGAGLFTALFAYLLIHFFGVQG